MPYSYQVFQHGRPAPESTESQDAGRLLPAGPELEKTLGRCLLVGIADGIGSLAVPRVASQLAVAALDAYFPEIARNKDPIAILTRLAVLIHRRIQKEGQDRQAAKGMGSTMALVALVKGQAHVVNVGDTRVYLYRRQKLKRVTRDQVRAVKGLRSGQLVEYLGMPGRDPQPQGGSFPLEPGDIMLACTDGLHGMMDDEELLGCFRGGKNVQEIGGNLVEELDTVGWADDVTFALVAVVPEVGFPADR